MGKVRITIDYEEIDVILQALIMFDTDLEEFKCLENPDKSMNKSGLTLH